MDSELTHFGIKGMKWGVRRAEKEQKRFDDNVAKGMSPSQAREAEQERKTKIRKAVIVGASLALLYGPTLLAYSQVGAQNRANNYVSKKTAQAGAKVAANMMADSRGLSSYKVVDVAFDAASGKWR